MLTTTDNQTPGSKVVHLPHATLDRQMLATKLREEQTLLFEAERDIKAAKHLPSYKRDKLAVLYFQAHRAVNRRRRQVEAMSVRAL